MTAERLNYVASVLSWHVRDLDRWHDVVLEQLADSQVTLEAGELRRAGEYYGAGRFLGVAEAESAYGDLPWFSTDDQGEFRGRPIGFWCWEVYYDGTAIAVPVCTGCRGTVARVDSGESRSCIVERVYNLRNLTHKHGFGGGSELLSRTDDRYAEAVVRKVERALADAGYEIHVGFGLGAFHNPLRASGDLYAYGRYGEQDARVPDDKVGAILSEIEVELSTLDFAIGDDEEFWDWTRVSGKAEPGGLPKR